eukprot:SAG11_NODE_1947_length_4015_cov_20.610827_4_plen_275_part_00
MGDINGGEPDWRVALGVGAALGASCINLLAWRGTISGPIASVESERAAATAAAAAQEPAQLHQELEVPAQSVALVTGAGPGTMGGCIAEALAALGCSIAAVEHPMRLEECEDLCRSLRSTHGVKAVALTADATNAAQVEASFVEAAAALGHEVNIAVSTVGGGGVAKDGGLRNGGTDMEGLPRSELAHEESWETTSRILAVTQFSAHHCCKAAARHMIAGGRGGSIIVVGSVMADFCHPTSSAYTVIRPRKLQNCIFWPHFTMVIFPCVPVAGL